MIVVTQLMAAIAVTIQNPLVRLASLAAFLHLAVLLSGGHPLFFLVSQNESLKFPGLRTR